jgi:hypothetical protein
MDPKNVFLSLSKQVLHISNTPKSFLKKYFAKSSMTVLSASQKVKYGNRSRNAVKWKPTEVEIDISPTVV